jgi:hypothetical protein
MDGLGQGHLFVGQSGAGKTTMARLWQNDPGISILSDDRIVLRQMGGQLWMFGTPWHGEEEAALPARAPLKRVYFLSHGPESHFEPRMVATPWTDMMARILAAAFVPFYDKGALDFILGFIEGMVNTVPGYELTFAPDARVVELIQGFRD